MDFGVIFMLAFAIVIVMFAMSIIIPFLVMVLAMLMMMMHGVYLGACKLWRIFTE